MIRFGPSGIDAAFCELHSGRPTTLNYLGWLGQAGLTAYEINFTRGVRIGEITARAIGEVARANNICVSGHAPYYVNLANADPAVFAKNYAYIADSLAVLRAINAPDDNGRFRLVIHVGSQCDLTRDAAIENCRRNLAGVIEKLGDVHDVLLCIETMGRYKQIGDYREIIDLCSVHECVVPTLDFGHINCLEQGELGVNVGRIGEILGEIGAKLGGNGAKLGAKMRHLHIHFSAIIFTQKGEHAHTTLDDVRWNFPYEPLGEYIRAHNLEPIIICESKGRQALDAIKLMGYHKA